MVSAHGMGTSKLQFAAYVHSWQWLKQAFAKLQDSFMRWRALCKQPSSSSARLVVQLSHMPPFLLLDHKPWASQWTMALSPAATVFRVQCSSSSCAAPKHKGEPPAMRREQQSLPYPTNGNHHHMDLAKVTARACGIDSSELAFQHSQSHCLFASCSSL